MASPVVLPKKTFFYPVGNTTPTCFTQDLAPEVNANVLLLACGDPRSILYTIHTQVKTSEYLAIIMHRTILTDLSRSREKTGLHLL